MEENQTEESLTKEEIVQKRKNNLIEFLKKPGFWIVIGFVLLIILGVYIRIQPMNINPNTGNPGLWDITTNTWTLGPDLDPWLFTRQAQIIVEQGGLPERDMMRNFPLGLDNSKEMRVLPYMIVGLHDFFNIFSDTDVIFAALFFPVIMFALTLITFFLFVRELFLRKSKESKTRANIIALISGFFLAVIPVFLPRTIAGIPEKESAAFFFIFLIFYLFLKAWKSKSIKKSIIFGILAGVSTGVLGAIWGGVLYVFITIAIASLIAFILNKVHKKGIIVYCTWVMSSFLFLLLLSKSYTFMDLINSLDTGLVSLVLFIFIIHSVIWNTRLKKIFYTDKVPRNIISLGIAIILAIILISIIFGPSYLVERAKIVNQILFTPTTGRWNRTVAENRQPYFTEWGSSFGPFVKNIPLMFWMFFIGSIVLFKKMLNKVKNKDAWILTGIYVLFFVGLVFSRYSSSSMFNGENFISKGFYYLSALLFIGSLIYYYLKYFKDEDKGFEMIRFEYLFLFAFFFFCLITTRSAVRLVMVLAPVASIFVGYLIVESIQKFRKTKDETWKVIFAVVIIIILISSTFTLFTFFKSSKGQARIFIPSAYNQQWQKAMSWVRTETPQDVVFAHWWDYGYWVQSIGERATVTDGGNAISFWNYWMGRMVLTGDNQKDALDFLYTHEVDYFLIDSSDIGKYTAFSSIGSDENFDRFSWIGTFLLDEKQSQETRNQTIYFYSGGVSLDEDLIIKENGKEILLPRQAAGVGAITITLDDKGAISGSSVIVIYQGRQHNIKLRYVFLNGEFIDFGSGIEATAFIFPRLIQDERGLRKNPIGAAMFISPRLMRGMFSQVYILDNPLDNFNKFELVHAEPNLIINDLRGQGMPLPDFVYFNRILGPIKIWKIKYTGDEEFKEKYLDKDPTKYINFVL